MYLKYIDFSGGVNPVFRSAAPAAGGPTADVSPVVSPAALQLAVAWV